jgi:hypothetical protein
VSPYSPGMAVLPCAGLWLKSLGNIGCICVLYSRHHLHSNWLAAFHVAGSSHSPEPGVMAGQPPCRTCPWPMECTAGVGGGAGSPRTALWGGPPFCRPLLLAFLGLRMFRGLWSLLIRGPGDNWLSPKAVAPQSSSLLSLREWEISLFGESF